VKVWPMCPLDVDVAVAVDVAVDVDVALCGR